MAEEDIDFMEGSRTRNLNLKTKTLERAKRLAKKLPKDLKENLRKVVELHKKAWTAPCFEIPKNIIQQTNREIAYCP